jgi:hypothetical protein
MCLGRSAIKDPFAVKTDPLVRHQRSPARCVLATSWEGAPIDWPDLSRTSDHAVPLLTRGAPDLGRAYLARRRPATLLNVSN